MNDCHNIIEVSARACGVTVERMLSSSRIQREAILPRQIAIFLMIESGMGYAATGRAIGRHHKAVMEHYKNRFPQLLKKNTYGAFDRLMDAKRMLEGLSPKGCRSTPSRHQRSDLEPTRSA